MLRRLFAIATITVALLPAAVHAQTTSLQSLQYTPSPGYVYNATAVAARLTSTSATTCTVLSSGPTSISGLWNPTATAGFATATAITFYADSGTCSASDAVFYASNTMAAGAGLGVFGGAAGAVHLYVPALSYTLGAAVQSGAQLLVLL